MTPATLDPPARRVLRALFELAQLDRPADAGLLARAINFSLARESAGSALRAVDVGRVLLVLEARGLASAEHARLTLAGLAAATRCEPLQLESFPWLSARPERPIPTRALGLRTSAGARAALHAGLRARSGRG